MKQQALEVTAGAGLVIGTFTLGLTIGMIAKNIFNALQGYKSKAPQLFSGDPIVEAAKRL